MINFSIFGTNHIKAPVEIREKFALNKDTQLEILERLAVFADEIVLLSTCNRTEVIYRGKNQDSHEKIREILAFFGNVERHHLDSFFYFLKGKQALLHLFRVASGLDSMVFGETQILGQTKTAFEFSLKRGYSKDRFHQIYQRMLNTAKTVRRETGVGKGSVSVGSVAVQLAKNIFDNLNDKMVVLIGAGEMCELAAEHFIKSGVKEIAIINRSHDKAVQLAEKYSASAHTMDALPHLMVSPDIILSSVTCKDPILTYGLLHNIMKKRRGKSLFIMDIAVPRNVEVRVNDLADVYLYNIDDLQQLVRENLKKRHREAASAEKLIQKKVDEIINFNGKLAGELILSLQERVTKIKYQELEHLFQRNKDFSDADKQQVEQTVNSIINKILHDPIISLRRGLSKNNVSDRYIIRRFKDFFNL